MQTFLAQLGDEQRQGGGGDMPRHEHKSVCSILALALVAVVVVVLYFVHNVDDDCDTM